MMTTMESRASRRTCRNTPCMFSEELDSVSYQQRSILFTQYMLCFCAEAVHNTHTHTHNHFTALWNLSGTTRVNRYQKKHSPTTLIVVINHPNLLSPSTTIHGILRIQSTCSTVFFHNLSPSFLWSTSWPVTSTSYSIHFLCL